MQVVSIPISKMNEQNLTKESWLLFASSVSSTSFPLHMWKEAIELLFPVIDLGIVIEITLLSLCFSISIYIKFICNIKFL